MLFEATFWDIAKIISCDLWRLFLYRYIYTHIQNGLLLEDKAIKEQKRLWSLNPVSRIQNHYSLFQQRAVLKKPQSYQTAIFFQRNNELHRYFIFSKQLRQIRNDIILKNSLINPLRWKSSHWNIPSMKLSIKIILKLF